MGRILLVEDSIEFHKIVVRALSHHQVICTVDVEQAMVHVRNEKVDLVLLDLNLPVKNGYIFLTELQATPSARNLPVICLTGKSDVTDKVTAFSLGVEDYIVKPFDPIELKARVDAKLLRSRRLADEHNVFVSLGLEIDLSSHRVSVEQNGQKKDVPVTQTEFKLLWCLTRRPDQVYSRDQLLVAAWGENASVLDRVVDVHLCSLRKKLGSYGAAIQAVPGVGYRFSGSLLDKKVA